MSYIKNIPIKSTVGNCINYITNEKKTDGHLYVGDSGLDYHIANTEWENIRKKFNKNSGILAHHFVQAFSPEHGVNAEEAHAIGMELAEKQFGKLGFDFIVTTHVDTLRFDKDGNQLSGKIFEPDTMKEMYDYFGNKIPEREINYKPGEKIGGTIHNHILVNNVSRDTGRKYYHDKKTYKYLRQLNIDICRNHGIPAMDAPTLDNEIEKGEQPGIEPLGKKYRSKPYIKTHAYDSWTQRQISSSTRIRNDINSIIKESDNWEDFIERMENIGYRIDWKKKDGEEKKYVTYTPPNAERGKRDRTLGIEFFSKQAIEKRIEKERLKRQHDNKILQRVRITKVAVQKTVVKQKYYIDPNWDVRPIYYGKSRFRRRSWWEHLIIKAFFKKRDVVNKFENENKKQSVPVNNNFRERSRKELEKTLAMIQCMGENGIKNKEDAEYLKSDFKIQSFIKEEEVEELKKELKGVDDLIEAFNVKEKYSIIMEQYNNLTNKEKEDFYYLNRFAIQQYALANRTLEKSGTELSDYEDAKSKQRELQEQIQKVTNEVEKIKADMNAIDDLISHIKQLELNERNEKVRAKQENKNHRESR